MIELRIGIDGRWISIDTGGVKHYIVNLLLHLAKIDDTNEYVVYVMSEGARMEIPTSRNFRVVVKQITNKFGWFLSLPFNIKENRVMLFHSPAYTLPIRKTCRSIVTIHDILFRSNPEWFPFEERYLWDYLVKRSAKKADMIITPSYSTKNDLLEKYCIDEEKIRVIPLGVNPILKEEGDVTKKILESKLGLTSPFILFVGAISPRRNIDKMMDAFYRLKERNCWPHKLVIVGRFWNDAQRTLFNDKIERLKLGNDVLYFDNVSELLLSTLYRGAEAFFYPSLGEGFGLPLLEAMAHGVPVAASNIPSLLEVSGGIGLFFDPSNPDNMASTLHEMLADSNLQRKLRTLGLKRSRQYTWDRTARETFQVFDEVGGMEEL